jgi:hypothetical protein
MGRGWSGSVGKPVGTRSWRVVVSSTKPLLSVFFGVAPWRIVAAPARPVTPEVAGSSPVAPVTESSKDGLQWWR